MNDLRSFAALQTRVYEFLERQDEATLRAIITGSAQLGVVTGGDVPSAGSVPPENVRIPSRSQPVVPGIEPSLDPVQVAYELSQLPSERRRPYLSAIKLTVSELRDVAKRRGLRRYSKLAKAELVEVLINYGSVSTGSAADQPRPPAPSPAAPPDGPTATGNVVIDSTAGEDGIASDESRPTAAVPPIEPAEPNAVATRIASHLRETETEEEGAAYLRAQQLDRATLLAVATELHLTRVDRLSRTELEKRLLKQAIGARRKFAGLRKW